MENEKIFTDVDEFLAHAGLRSAGIPSAYNTYDGIYERMKERGIFEGGESALLGEILEIMREWCEGDVAPRSMSQIPATSMNALSEVLARRRVSKDDYEGIMSYANRGFLDKQFRKYQPRPLVNYNFCLSHNGDLLFTYGDQLFDLGYHTPFGLASFCWMLNKRREKNIFSDFPALPCEDDEVSKEVRTLERQLELREDDFGAELEFISGSNTQGYTFYPGYKVRITPNEYNGDRKQTRFIPTVETAQIGIDFVHFAANETKYGKYQDLIPQLAGLLGRL